MQRETTIDAPEAATAPPGPAPERTAASGWVLRGVTTAYLVAGFAQPVFAGVYLSGDFDGLAWHVRGADLVSYIAIAHLGAAAAVWVRGRRAWPFWSSLALVAGVTAQYFAGTGGALWLHFPLGAALVAGIAGAFAAVWRRPLPRRAKEVRADG
ncbi:hypothetical protein ACFQS3_12155 [Glycomyces mayteni]|uniref:Integral membrane protein n=1 Tax=Glycomyces mayteni TaxID=543887 RepID=A0ABW2D9Q4_9ACTN|nr:hypothetical protein GCM10025732_34990 [Glycomyces mayteni]